MAKVGYEEKDVRSGIIYQSESFIGDDDPDVSSLVASWNGTRLFWLVWGLVAVVLFVAYVIFYS